MRILSGIPERPSRLRARWLISIWAVLAFTSDGAAQTGSISGRITDGSTNEALPGVGVYILGTAIGVVTNSSGRYTLANVPVGTHTVRFEYIGYRWVEAEVTVSAGASTSFDLPMEEAAIALDSLIVTGAGSAGLPWRSILLLAAIFLALEVGDYSASAKSRTLRRRTLIRIGAAVAVMAGLLELVFWIRYGFGDLWEVLGLVMDIALWWAVAAVSLAAVNPRTAEQGRMPWRRAVRRGAVGGLAASLVVALVRTVVWALALGWDVSFVYFLIAAGNGAIVGAFVALHQTLPSPWGRGIGQPEAAST